MKRFILVFALVFSQAPSSEENVLTGRLTDWNDHPVSNTVITVSELDYSTQTDSEGTFVFAGHDNKTYTLIIEYQQQQHTVLFIPGSYKNVIPIRLPDTSTERIVVTASPQSKPPLEMSRPVIVLEGDELAIKRGSNISETLAYEPGLTSSSFGSGAGRPVIRGLTGSRLTILTNGIGTLDASSTSPDHAVSSEPLLATQIEVLKGPASLLYGEGAIGGVINVVNSRIPHHKSTRALTGGAELRFDSAKSERAGVAFLTINKGNINLYADGYKRKSQDIELPTSLGNVLVNSDITASGTSLGGAWVANNSDFLGMSFADSKSNYGLPVNDVSDEFIRLSIEQKRTDLEAELSTPLKYLRRIRVKFANNDYEHVELEDGEIGTRFNNDATEFRMEVNHEPTENLQSVSGIHLFRRSYSAIGEEAFVPPSSANSVGVFWVGERTFNNLNVDFGLRLNRHEIKSDAFTGSILRNTLSSSVRGLFELGKGYSMAVAFSYAQRSPNVEELLSNGPHLAAQSFEVGDRNLKKETSGNVDLSIRKTSGTLQYQLNAYYNGYSDFIFERPTGNFEEALPVFRYSQEDAIFMGLEFEADWHLMSIASYDMSINGMFDYVRGKLKTGGDLPRIPPLRAGIGITIEKSDWQFNALTMRYLPQNNVAAFESATMGYTLVNLDMNYRYYSGPGEWLFFIRATNLLDDDIVNHTSFIKDIAPEAGRSINIGTRISF